MDRRTLLRASTATVVTGLLLPGVAYANPSYQSFPDVPGMLGDRRANEFWYEYDNAVMFTSTAELEAAYQQIRDHTGGFPYPLMEKWFQLVATPEYPRNFAEYVAPLRDPLRLISRTQLDVIDKFYRPGSRGLVDAFSYFGQGVLFDPRRAEAKAEVHTMDGAYAYHAWYVYQRAMMMLGIDAARWARISPLVAFSWAVFAVARPNTRTVSPALPHSTVARLAAQWLPKSIRQLDQDFRTGPYPAGTN
ncbi:hypothetical protein LWC34_05275 [Kibdelosporangium philippinense]|uniref:Secreted protein n=1 Tax=Kibdelosporangium philippinense TaxID=211113 RepID=A0ABS8Z2S6_9PSEU|nr:hypothetical protein [Kibdelosporangium philippinense]MCE7002241.1 hypothetical protein [Kibdelosporangium philippinense]